MENECAEKVKAIWATVTQGAVQNDSEIWRKGRHDPFPDCARTPSPPPPPHWECQRDGRAYVFFREPLNSGTAVQYTFQGEAFHIPSEKFSYEDGTSPSPPLSPPPTQPAVFAAAAVAAAVVPVVGGILCVCRYVVKKTMRNSGQSPKRAELGGAMPASGGNQTAENEATDTPPA
ncbi:hypothetical protein MATL_G00124500 [Megalops atlanticus]|uniref:Uncharacterized protein n=1 Tax=Megalops atlanticus TaxID=7932 RepID=A0A9D3PXE0_MEGAT|nr:hypothetical protein MATL_G00124500 [Megalops atlanticus]